MMEPSKIQSIIKSLAPVDAPISSPVSPSNDIPFDALLDTALAINDVIGKGQESKSAKDLKFGIVNQKQFPPEVIEEVSKKWVEPKSDVIAQVFPNDNRSNQDRLIAQVPDDFEDDTSSSYIARQGTILPFQVFIEKGVDLLGRISALETKSDNLMEQYMAGKVSVEEFTVVKAQVGVMLTFATNLLNQAVTVFKEIQGMQI